MSLTSLCYSLSLGELQFTECVLTVFAVTISDCLHGVLYTRRRSTQAKGEHTNSKQKGRSLDSNPGHQYCEADLLTNHQLCHHELTLVLLISLCWQLCWLFYFRMHVWTNILSLTVSLNSAVIHLVRREKKLCLHSHLRIQDMRQIQWSQSCSLNCSLGCAGVKCSYRHPYAWMVFVMENLWGAENLHLTGSNSTQLFIKHTKTLADWMRQRADGIRFVCRKW